MPSIPMSSDQIVEDIADRIRRNQYPPGSQLPSYRSLMALYDVSYATIGHVIVRLKERSLVVGVKGRGVFVAEGPKRKATDSPFAT